MIDDLLKKHAMKVNHIGCFVAVILKGEDQFLLWDRISEDPISDIERDELSSRLNPSTHIASTENALMGIIEKESSLYDDLIHVLSVSEFEITTDSELSFRSISGTY
jgi:hypothetical protein